MPKSTEDQQWDRPLRMDPLFSGYGGLDVAFEPVLLSKTVWFSNPNKSVAHVFSRH